MGLGVSNKTLLTKQAVGPGWPVGYDLLTFVAVHRLDRESGQLVGMDVHLTAQEEASLPWPTVNMFTQTGARPGSVRGRGLWTPDTHNGHAQGRQAPLPLAWHRSPGWARCRCWPCCGLHPSLSPEATHGGLQGLPSRGSWLCILISATKISARQLVCALWGRRSETPNKVQ